MRSREQSSPCAAFETTGMPCIRSDFPFPGMTTFYHEVVTPGGQVQLICHLPD
jgi:hypothetical protein